MNFIQQGEGFTLILKILWGGGGVSVWISPDQVTGSREGLDSSEQLTFIEHL